MWAVCRVSRDPWNAATWRQLLGPRGSSPSPRRLSQVAPGHLLRDIVTQPRLLCQPRGPAPRGPKGHILPPSLHGDAFWVVCRARGKAKEESPPSPALAAPAALGCLLRHLSQDRLTVNSHNHSGRPL